MGLKTKRQEMWVLKSSLNVCFMHTIYHTKDLPSGSEGLKQEDFF